MVKKMVIRNSLCHTTLRISDDRFFCHYTNRCSELFLPELKQAEVYILITNTYYAILLPGLNRCIYKERITYICTILAK